MNLAERVELWNKLQVFSFDENESYVPFLERLCTEQGWTSEYAARAIEEYKRFLFLMMATGKRVTPSEIVDKVWHLHLIYTESYWDDLCHNVLKKRLHHQPGNAPKESPHFQEQYQKTFDLYLKYIGHEPPADIWGERKAK